MNKILRSGFGSCQCWVFHVVFVFTYCLVCVYLVCVSLCLVSSTSCSPLPGHVCKVGEQLWEGFSLCERFGAFFSPFEVFGLYFRARIQSVLVNFSILIEVLFVISFSFFLFLNRYIYCSAWRRTLEACHVSRAWFLGFSLEAPAKCREVFSNLLMKQVKENCITQNYTLSNRPHQEGNVKALQASSWPNTPAASGILQ